MKKSKFSEAQIVKSLKEYEGGRTAEDICRELGIDCYMFDMAHGEDYGTVHRTFKGKIITYGGQIQQHRKLLGELCRNNKVILLGAFPPCTDLAFSGAPFFMKKSMRDSFFWAKAMELYFLALDLAEYHNIPYFCENPKSMIKHFDRRPDYAFDPYEYGGYLPRNHQHAYFPNIYPGRDAYIKKTWIWCGNGFAMPPRKPIEPVKRVFPGWTKVGGTSAKAKEIRSVTPEGFSKAVFVGNMPGYHL